MDKSNKELAVELTIAYIQSWNAKNSTNAIKTDDAIDILNSFEKTLSKMDAE